MHLLVIDTETLDLLDACAEMMEKAMLAREKRFPPDHLLSRTAALQKGKMTMVRHAARKSRIVPWTQKREQQRRDALKLMAAMITTAKPTEADAIWNALGAMLVDTADADEATEPAQAAEASEVRSARVPEGPRPPQA